MSEMTTPGSRPAVDGPPLPGVYLAWVALYAAPTSHDRLLDAPSTDACSDRCTEPAGFAPRRRGGQVSGWAASGRWSLRRRSPRAARAGMAGVVSACGFARRRWLIGSQAREQGV